MHVYMHARTDACTQACTQAYIQYDKTFRVHLHQNYEIDGITSCPQKKEDDEDLDAILAELEEPQAQPVGKKDKKKKKKAKEEEEDIDAIMAELEGENAETTEPS